jgi:uncharacterized protein (DUF2235 family)
MAKNIVLLSDGTGNSSAKLFKTNVWRVYEALDLTGDGQVAFYDNGVGTSTLKPLALLGGAFGWGLKRNVRDIYAFLCRNYESGDRIYAFGFSRGAFTIRVLTGLIKHEGVITGQEGRELTRLATWAYRRYRRRYNPTGKLVRVLRSIRDRIFRAWDRMRGRPSYESVADSSAHPEIHFLGLWDTVAAYGLPIDELTRGWSRWIWPLTLPDRRMSTIVGKACHALSLDDERETFHPLLWDESGTTNDKSRVLDDEVLSQVWFAGAHSNVGGGYPDDTLAHVSLCWIAGEAAKRQLEFSKQLRTGQALIPDAWVQKASAKGPLNDSRQGLNAFYRYNPRDMSRLSHDRYNGVHIARPKIHESVVERMARGTDGYAPVVLPRGYAVVARDGSIADGSGHPLEDEKQSLSRAHDQERAWNLVWKRRVVYFTTVAVWLALAARPFGPGQGRIGLLNGNFPVLSAIAKALGGMLPALASPWVSYYTSYPLKLVAGGLALGVLLLESASLQQRIREAMRAVWRPILSRPVGPTQVSPAPTDWIYRLRTHRVYRAFYSFLKRTLVPDVFGLLMLTSIALAAATVVDHFAFGLASVGGLICRDAPQAAPVAAGRWEAPFRSDSLCQATGIRLEEGARYRIELTLPPRLAADPPDGAYVPGRSSGVWMDGSYAVETPAGLARDRAWIYTLAWPLKRALSAGWFVPIARVGATGGQYQALDVSPTELTARESGQLFLYVNDAVVPCPRWDCLYRNNTGGPAQVVVTRIADEAPR